MQGSKPCRQHAGAQAVASTNRPTCRWRRTATELRQGGAVQVGKAGMRLADQISACSLEGQNDMNGLLCVAPLTVMAAKLEKTLPVGLFDWDQPPLYKHRSDATSGRGSIQCRRRASRTNSVEVGPHPVLVERCQDRDELHQCAWRNSRDEARVPVGIQETSLPYFGRWLFRVDWEAWPKAALAFSV